MKQFDIKEYNKMCAEFLGYVNLTPDDPDFDFYEHPTEPVKLGEHIRKTLEPMSMLFHTDWNWIMEVVEKINSTYVFNDLPDTTLLDIREEMRAYLGLSNKEAVVNSIWEFLNWYKTNKI